MNDAAIGEPMTIADVAAAASVSVRTVSRVLNQSAKVNEHTRRAVQDVIERLNYSPSLRARALAAGRSYLIGIIHDDPNALVLDTVQRGVVERCVARGYEVIVHPARLADPEVAAEIARFVRRSHVDGLVVLPPLSEVLQIPALLADLKVPAIGLASVRIPSYPAMLVTDERAGAHLLGQHLIGLGHRKIGFITGPRAFHSAVEREQGFKQALREAGVTLQPTHVREGDYSFDSGVRAAEAILGGADRPTAIFASNDVMAAGVLNVAARLRLRVPDQLSVAGFDGSVLARMLSPTLTTVHRPLNTMASQATTLLLDMIEDPALTWSADLGVQLTLEKNDSTGPCPSANIEPRSAS